MGMYCVCDVKKDDPWTCKCDWNGWYLCYEQKVKNLHSIPVEVPVKEIPDKDGKYLVRCFEDGDDFEDISEFSTIAKNWGQKTNQAISHWKITYNDGWMGCRGVYAWKMID